MTSEVFPVEKSNIVYGQATFKMKGKRYEEIMANMPLYLQKIDETRAKVAAMVSVDEVQANQDYLVLRQQFRSRDNDDSYIPDPDKDFEEKMLLIQYAEILGLGFVGKTFKFLYDFGPLDFLDLDYTVYNMFIGGAAQSFYLHDNRLRKEKIVSMTHDYCRDLAVSLAQDPGWNSGTALNAYDLVFRCYDGFPFRRDAAEKVYDLVLFMTDFYVFTNFTSNGAGALKFVTYLREQELQFDSNFRFINFMSRVINQFNDAHVTVSIDCYNQFIFIQPLYFQIIADGNSNIDLERIVITKSNSPALKQWEGYYVRFIDGIDAYAAVASYVNSLGRSHEQRMRMAFGVSKIVWDSDARDFRLDRGMFLKRTDIPDRPYVVYTVQKPGSDYYFEFKVYWMVFKGPTLQEFGSQRSYWKKHCAALPYVKQEPTVPVTPNNLQKRNSKYVSDKMKLQRISSPVLMRKSNNDEPLNPTCEGITPEAIGPGFAFFIMKDPVEGDYGVLVIQTFDVTDMENWFKNMRKGFLKLKEKGIKKLLLDLSSNYGGVLCLAYSLLGVLSPHPTLPFPATKLIFGTRAIPNEKVLAFSKCADEARLKISPFKLQSFSNMTCHCEFPSTATWSTGAEIKPKIIAGFINGYSMFSPFLVDKCTSKYSYLLEDVKPNFDRIIVVSDGTCGSSCAIVALYFQVAGFPCIIIYSSTKPLAFNPNMYSFAGGQVVSTDNVMDVAKRSSCYSSVPKTIERIRATMTYRAIFNDKDIRIPMEYYVSPASAALRFTNDIVSSISNRWRKSFSLAMDVINDPEKYVADLSDEVLISGISAS